MAEKTMTSRDAANSAEAIARRPSFRKTLRDDEQTLPVEYLDALELKRKQLDESIHKYIASKEREYKVFEKELKYKSRGDGAVVTSLGAQAEHAEGNGSVSQHAKRRTSSESAQGSVAGSPFLGGQHSEAVKALMASGSRRSNDGQVDQDNEHIERADLAGLQDAGASEERDKEFVGLFTPSYLPAIDHKEAEQPDSSPEVAPASNNNNNAAGALESSPRRRDGSDPLPNAKAKRPAHLQLTARTSSSGSSADGKLASAMKSPSHPTSRPMRKRVSLAVGDSIVAPSDNVPSALHISSTPSHSRTRSPDNEPVVVPAGISATLDFAVKPVLLSAVAVDGAGSNTASTPADVAARPLVPGSPGAVMAAPSSTRNINADGDLFDLEDEAEMPPHDNLNEFEDTLENEEKVEAANGVIGRISTSAEHHETSLIPTRSPRSPDALEYVYDPEAGLIPEPPTALAPQQSDLSSPNPTPTRPSGFAPTASQQPSAPGFRRPSVIADPQFRGPDNIYASEELKAATEELYGSSYTRPSTKGSFVGGSVGQSYMAMHAAQMMQMRAERGEQGVR
ncbi:hypothetical protein LTR62_007820 [Meristemomyces frigidus]|uniref:Uncharacterized protein n=1 Tax=Meristemomyces frigidus TaxID=1508187 RepID=A0AAN7TBB7_9PEZI|nr:hypothetical protein LTR62_007820 [Meristemomyces frigidus]